MRMQELFSTFTDTQQFSPLDIETSHSHRITVYNTRAIFKSKFVNQA